MLNEYLLHQSEYLLLLNELKELQPGLKKNSGQLLKGNKKPHTSFPSS